MKSRRILIVDDEAPIVEMLREGLVAEGFVVDAAGDAAEALRLVHDNLYDAAVLDFALPDMNGVMLHREIRQLDEELAERTVFISGVEQSKSDLGYYTSVGSGFLAKPFELPQLLTELDKLMAPLV